MALFESRSQALQRMAAEKNCKARDVAPLISGRDFLREYRTIPARTLISGGLQRNRLWFLDGRIRLAMKSGFSAVAILCPQDIHNGYGVPFEAVSGRYKNPYGPIFFRDGTAYGFDPLLSVNPQSLPSLLAEVSASINERNIANSDFWRYVLYLLHAAYPRPGLRELLELDMLNLPGAIGGLVHRGLLDPATAERIAKDYTPGLNAQAAAAANLCSTLTPLLRFLREKNVGMAELAQKQGLLLLDTLPANSQGSINLIFALLQYVSQNICPIALVTDGVGCDSHDVFRSRFFSQTDVSLPVVIGGDIPASMPELFTTLCGGNSLKVVLSHDTGNGNELWSKAMGEFAETIVETNAGQSQSNVALVERNQNEGVSTRVDQHSLRIKQADLQNLAPGQAYVRIPEIFRIQPVEFLEMRLEELKEDLFCFVTNC